MASMPPWPAVRACSLPRVVADARGVVEGERPGHGSGGDFADAVSGNGGWMDAVGGEQPCQRNLQGEVQRLRHFGPVDTRAGPVAKEFGGKREARGAVEGLVEFVYGIAEAGIVPVQLSAHSPPLRAHAGEDEQSPAAADSGAAAISLRPPQSPAGARSAPRGLRRQSAARRS